MKISFMRSTPRRRAEFERNLHILKEQLDQGKLKFASHINTDSLLRVRTLPNGRIDLSSVDEFVRSQANTLADMLSRADFESGAADESDAAPPTSPEAEGTSSSDGGTSG